MDSSFEKKNLMNKRYICCWVQSVYITNEQNKLRNLMNKGLNWEISYLCGIKIKFRPNLIPLIVNYDEDIYRTEITSSIAYLSIFVL